jgi:glycosyltransferase involved in cell wall biosynthesis
MGAYDKEAIRVLYSFPHKLGAQRICYLAWEVLNSLQAAGATVVALPGTISKPPPPNITVWPTLARGKLSMPYRILGSYRTILLHDFIVSRRLPEFAGRIDVVHGWPVGSLRTLRVAKQLGIPTVLERCNAHTRFAYAVVRRECERLNLTLPKGHEHAFNERVLKREQEEYSEADCILCPSEFVARTFVDEGFSRDKLAYYRYGFDEKLCFADPNWRAEDRGLIALFAAECAPRKGLHYALDAWLSSSACRNGTLLIAGRFVSGYADRLKPQLEHPSVRVIGFRTDLPSVMRSADILILPSIEEGSALVTWDGRGCGCVLLVSAASGAPCKHMETGLIHEVGDVRELSRQITLLDRDRQLLSSLRRASLAETPTMTWAHSGRALLAVYRALLSKLAEV